MYYLCNFEKRHIIQIIKVFPWMKNEGIPDARIILKKKGNLLNIDKYSVCLLNVNQN